ncbi:hypothetical protein C0992_001638 [Termitomyces sp. T32_za158]|nr:hypothetical protein C0992_001638 [Termitomyces sp. T32_za158]
MVQYDKKLLWHPRGSNRFIVGGGSQITLYEWTPSHPEIRQVTSQHDLQHLKCFAWSPDPILDDFVAVGNLSGRIELLRLEASRVSQRRNSLSSGQGIPLTVRNSRSCNSLAFCSVDPNYLASGFDKVRGDCSLIIWDINTASATLSVPLGQSSNHDTVKRPPRPEPIISQADVGRGADSRVLQQHASTETVSVVSFLPQSTTQLLAGISHRWLRLFDLRNPVAVTLNVASKVQGIATDSFDPHRIACFGDGVITVWDTRKLQMPSLTFTEKDASADGAQLHSNSLFSGLEFSHTRRGLLASMEREASYVRFWNILDVNDGVPLNESKAQDTVRAGRRSWANIPWPSGVHTNQGPPSTNNQDSHGLILFDTRKTKTFARPLSSFALAPSATRHPLTTNVMVVSKDGDLELYAVYDTPKPAVWSSRGDLAIAAGPSCRIVEAPQDDDVPEDMLQSTSSLFGRAMTTNGDSYEYLCVPKSVLHGFDFSYQGLLGIWEGFKPLTVTQAPNLVATNNYYDLSEQWESHPSIDELYGNFSAAIGAWEAEGELSKVACWLVFTKQHAKAISLLMKSSDESHCMLSGTIAALVPHGPKTTELREHCERLIVRVQDPYFRAILTHLALNDWSEVLEEEALPFRERLAVAFQFLDDKALTSYLRRCQDRAISRGDIDAIIIPGLASKAGLDILQGFVNHTGDVQSAAIMGSLVYPPRNPNQARGVSAMERRVERWVESYRDLLDGFKMFHRRVEFDIERGHIALKRVVARRLAESSNWEDQLHAFTAIALCQDVPSV